MPLKVSSEKMVPVEAMRELTHGSYEHLSLRLDDAIAENKHLFNTESNIARIATFKEHVIVGSSAGQYFAVPYQDYRGQIQFAMPEHIDVPLVGMDNVGEFKKDSLDNIVDALMTGKRSDGIDGIIEYLNLSESIEDNAQDLASIVYEIISSNSDWKRAYKEQRNTIINQLGGKIEDIQNSALLVKYTPLYDGSVDESKFSLYLEPARQDLHTVYNRLESLENYVDHAYLSFKERASKDELGKQDKETVEQFIKFAAGLSSEVHDLREHVKIGLENEQCAMCLGQIHDAIAESLPDYEIAGSFVKKMASMFVAQL